MYLRSFLCFLCVMSYSFTPHLYSCEFNITKATFRVGDTDSYFIGVVGETGGAITHDPLTFPESISFEPQRFTPNIGKLSGTPIKGTEGSTKYTFVYQNDTCTTTQEFTLEIISATTPSSPDNQNGTRVEAAARAKKDPKFCNIITWDAPKKGGPKIVAYRIYRDKNLQHLLSEIPRHARKHYRVIHPNRDPCKSDKYYIVSVSALDNESLPVLVNIKAKRRQCLRD